MIGLVIQLARLCLGALTLLTRLLVMLIEQAAALLGRRAAAAKERANPEGFMRDGPASPSRRRAFVAPPRRARRSGL